jgi:hypothetical protein
LRKSAESREGARSFIDKSYKIKDKSFVVANVIKKVP